MRNGQIRRILLWRDARVSGAIFCIGLLLLAALTCYSVLVVVTCILIPLLTLTLSVRALYAMKCALLKTPQEHPFQQWLDESWEIRGDKMDSVNKMVVDAAYSAVLRAKKVVLVADFADSTKSLFKFFMAYYVGKTVSGMTLLFLGFTGAFTVPKLYDAYRREIDAIIRSLLTKYEALHSRILGCIPGLSKALGSKKSLPHKHAKKESPAEKHHESEKEKEM